MHERVRRDRVGEIDARDPVRAADGDHLLVVERARHVHERAIRREAAVLVELAERVVRIGVLGADDALVRPAEKIRRIAELDAEAARRLQQRGARVLARRAIGQRGAIRRRHGAVDRIAVVVIGQVVVVDVAVAGVRLEMPIERVAREHERVAEILRRGEVQGVEAIVGEVRRVARVAPVREHAFRRGAVAEEIRVGERITQVDVGLVGLPSDFSEGLLDGARRELAPAVFVEIVAREEVVEVAGRAAGRAFERAASERAAVRFDFAAGIVVAVLRAHHQRAAERVEAEHRIGARHQRDFRDRGLRDQVPVHRVAERFVDAHAVDVDGQAFGRAEQRRRREAVVVDIELKRIRRALARGDAREVRVEVARKIERRLLFHRRVIGGLHGGRNLVQRQAEPFERRRRDDVDLRELGRRVRWRLGRRIG